MIVFYIYSIFLLEIFINILNNYDSSEVAPDGAEMFFDNVGGEWYHTIVTKHLKKYGRAALCGSIETYNELEPKLCI